MTEKLHFANQAQMFLYFDQVFHGYKTKDAVEKDWKEKTKNIFTGDERPGVEEHFKRVYCASRKLS